jgi:hypothetical protein
MAKLSDFYAYVLPDVPGCPEITADVSIRSALIEFCEKSLVVQRDHDPVSVLKGIADYDLEPPTGQLVVKLLKVWYRSQELKPVAPDNIDKAEVYNTLFANADLSQADPRQYLQKDEKTVSLFPIPKDTVANALTMRVALKPTRTAETLEDVLFQDYAEVIAYGAKYRLLGMANKPWTNGPGAANSFSLFNAGVNVARQRASRGNTRAQVRIHLTGV